MAHAGTVDGLAGGEVVAAVEHDVGLCGLFGQFVFIEKAGQGADGAAAVDAFQSVCEGLGFVAADVGFAKGGLPLQVGVVDGVAVGDVQTAYACGGEIGQGGRAEAVAADNEDGGGQEFFLSFDADFVK